MVFFYQKGGTFVMKQFREFSSEFLEAQEKRIIARSEYAEDVLKYGHDLHAKLKATVVLPSLLLALQRLKTGQYGICVECGEDILIQRLNVMPGAVYCVTCQKSHEKEAHQAH